VRPIGEGEVVPTVRKNGLLSVQRVTVPTMTLSFPPNHAKLAACVVICPGGGYDGLGIESEAAEIAKWLNSRDIIGAVLKYRVPKRHQGFPMHHHALQDAQRAIGLLRSEALKWNIDPRWIGIVGFSAGGHLAATLSNNYAERIYERVEMADDASCKPDFAILIYPAYVTDPIDSDALTDLMHVDAMSPRTTPPTFIASAQTDKFTHGAVAYYLALRKARVRGELHIYDGCGHGNGLRVRPLAEWVVPCGRWLDSLAAKPGG